MELVKSIKWFQSQLRELEKKVELERVEYEELMLELTLSKRHDKVETAEQQLHFSDYTQTDMYLGRLQAFKRRD